MISDKQGEADPSRAEKQANSTARRRCREHPYLLSHNVSVQSIHHSQCCRTNKHSVQQLFPCTDNFRCIKATQIVEHDLIGTGDSEELLSRHLHHPSVANAYFWWQIKGEITAGGHDAVCFNSSWMSIRQSCTDGLLELCWVNLRIHHELQWSDAIDWNLLVFLHRNVRSLSWAVFIHIPIQHDNSLFAAADADF